MSVCPFVKLALHPFAKSITLPNVQTMLLNTCLVALKNNKKRKTHLTFMYVPLP